MGSYYLAIDIGASSGRHILAEVEDGKMALQEAYRFQNGMQEKKRVALLGHSASVFRDQKRNEEM